jgi:leucyl-tRNA synthetase
MIIKKYKYVFKKIENEWQKKWDINKLFDLPQNVQTLKEKKKYYILDMFPYPSASGLHVGHPRGYTATDVLSRFKRMNGFNVLHPIGWDSFGLPAERASHRENIHPQVLTKKNINFFRHQIKKIGYSYNWKNEICTSDKEYYKWTQWLFLLLYNKRLAYKRKVAVNWCPSLNTVLANEEVQNGRYIETGDKVYLKYMSQWVLKITHYAHKLLKNLSNLDWPLHIKDMQKNWIGKSLGYNIRVKLVNYDMRLKVFIRFREILFGLSYVMLSPANRITKVLLSNTVKKNIDSTEKQTPEGISKPNLFINKFVLHPITGRKIPLFWAPKIDNLNISNLIIGLSLHENKVYDTYNQFKILTPCVLNRENQIDKNVNSSIINNMCIEQSRILIKSYLLSSEIMDEKVIYNLRDWLFSRQRYWGEPFPINYNNISKLTCSINKNIPVSLPIFDIVGNSIHDVLNSKLYCHWQISKTCSNSLKKEFQTMPQWAGSCWYYLRYIDSQNSEIPWGINAERYWMPVDLYIGGAEHAVLHLLYSRFWHQVLFDCKLVSTPEPFNKLFSQGLILSKSYRDEPGNYYHRDEIHQQDFKKYFLKSKKIEVYSKIEKMSKSKFNVYNPDNFIDKYGADAFRLHVLFLGPLDQSIIWHSNSMQGMFKLLSKIWDFFCLVRIKNISNAYDITQQEYIYNNISTFINSISTSIASMKLNLGISIIMQYFNYIVKFKCVPRNILLNFIKLLYPYAPHISSQIWLNMKELKSLSYAIAARPNPFVFNSLISIQISGYTLISINLEANYNLKSILDILQSEKIISKEIIRNPIKKIISKNFL